MVIAFMNFRQHLIHNLCAVRSKLLAHRVITFSDAVDDVIDVRLKLGALFLHAGAHVIDEAIQPFSPTLKAMLNRGMPVIELLQGRLVFLIILDDSLGEIPPLDADEAVEQSLVAVEETFERLFV